MEKICFIDNNLPQTCKVVEALAGYYHDQTGKPLSVVVILVNIDQNNDRETIDYFNEEVFSGLGTELKVCSTIGEVKEQIGAIDKEHTIAMVDLHMIEREEEKIAKDENYKCISMQCMDELESLDMKYVWYSSYDDNPFKNQWQRRFEKLYGREIPTIYERDELTLAYFNQSAAKEILGV